MSPTLWIGKLNQKTLVFDSSMQLPDCPHVFLWNTTSRAMEKYVPSVVKSLIRTNRVPEIAVHAATAYETWKHNDSQDWIEEEAKYYAERTAKEAREKAQRNCLAAAREKARETLVERHRKALQTVGGTYLGVRKPSAPRNPRITHCYSCNGHLDNSIDIECAACGWILCICSACGCGYQFEA